MAEIEVKVRVSDFEPLVKKLGELGCAVSESVRQEDVIFTNGETDRAKRNVIRIRTSRGKHVLTLKRDRGEDELDCIELETEVEDPGSMRQILEMMGYSESVRVNKERRKAKCGDYEICIDRVDGLGDFVEVEKISEESGGKIQAEILEFMQGLGIDISQRVLYGYDTLTEQAKSGVK